MTGPKISDLAVSRETSARAERDVEFLLGQLLALRDQMVERERVTPCEATTALVCAMIQFIGPWLAMRDASMEGRVLTLLIETIEAARAVLSHTASQVGHA